MIGGRLRQLRMTDVRVTQVQAASKVQAIEWAQRVSGGEGVAQGTRSRQPRRGEMFRAETSPQIVQITADDHRRCRGDALEWTARDEASQLFVAFTPRQAEVQVVNDDASRVAVPAASNLCLQHAALLAPTDSQIQVSCFVNGPTRQDHVAVVPLLEAVLGVEGEVPAKRFREQLHLVVFVQLRHVLCDLLEQRDVWIAARDDAADARQIVTPIDATHAFVDVPCHHTQSTKLVGGSVHAGATVCDRAQRVGQQKEGGVTRLRQFDPACHRRRGARPNCRALCADVSAVSAQNWLESRRNWPKSVGLGLAVVGGVNSISSKPALDVCRRVQTLRDPGRRALEWLLLAGALALSAPAQAQEAKSQQVHGQHAYRDDGASVSAALAHEALMPITSTLPFPGVNETWPALDFDSPLLRELQLRLGIARFVPLPLIVTGRKAHLDLLQARSGDATARGFLARTARGPTGTLLFSTPYANLDLSVVPGDVQVQVLWGRDLLSWGTAAPSSSR